MATGAGTHRVRREPRGAATRSHSAKRSFRSPRSVISVSARPMSIRIGRARDRSASSPSTATSPTITCDGADELADLDHRRAAEDGVGRQVQLVVGALPRRARDRPEPARVQVVGDQHRDRFAEPVGPRRRGRAVRTGATRIRRDSARQHRRAGAGRLARSAPRADQRERRSCGDRRVRRAPRRASPTAEQPFGRPDARHSLTRASRGTSNSCSTRAIAEA